MRLLDQVLQISETSLNLLLLELILSLGTVMALQVSHSEQSSMFCRFYYAGTIIDSSFKFLDQFVTPSIQRVAQEH